MSTTVWIIGWALVLAALAILVVREIRSGRKGPGDFDRMRHQSAADATTRSQATGPGTYPM